jgi:hypothetical protein
LLYDKLSYALEEINIHCRVFSILIKGERPEMTGYVISNISGNPEHATLYHTFGTKHHDINLIL